MGLIALPIKLYMADCFTCVLTENFLSCQSPAIRHQLLELLLPPSVSSTLYTLLLQHLSPFAFLQDSQLIAPVLWLFSFLIPCWWLILTGLLMYVSSGSPLLALLILVRNLSSDCWWGGFLSLDIFWSHPARSSLVPYLSFMFHNLPLVYFLCLTFSHSVIMGCMNKDVTQYSKTHWELVSEMGHGQVMDDKEGVLKGECRLKSKRRAAEYQSLPSKWNHRTFK